MKILKMTVLAMVVAVSGMNIYYSQMESKNLDHLTLENVEALAGVIVGEGDNVTTGQWKRIVDALGCYLRHECSLDGDGFSCSPIGSTTVIRN